MKNKKRKKGEKTEVLQVASYMLQGVAGYCEPLIAQIILI